MLLIFRKKLTPKVKKKCPVIENPFILFASGIYCKCSTIRVLFKILLFWLQMLWLSKENRAHFVYPQILLWMQAYICKQIRCFQGFWGHLKAEMLAQHYRANKARKLRSDRTQWRRHCQYPLKVCLIWISMDDIFKAPGIVQCAYLDIGK
jgi:hypothetical protein